MVFIPEHGANGSAKAAAQAFPDFVAKAKMQPRSDDGGRTAQGLLQFHTQACPPRARVVLPEAAFALPSPGLPGSFSMPLKQALDERVTIFTRPDGAGGSSPSKAKREIAKCLAVPTTARQPALFLSARNAAEGVSGTVPVQAQGIQWFTHFSAGLASDASPVASAAAAAVRWEVPLETTDSGIGCLSSRSRSWMSLDIAAAEAALTEPTYVNSGIGDLPSATTATMARRKQWPSYNNHESDSHGTGSDITLDPGDCEQ